MSNPIYTVDGCIEIPGATVETRSYCYPSPYEGAVDRHYHVLSLSLTPRVAFAQCAFVDEGGRAGPWVDTGDVIFAPARVRLLGQGVGGRVRRVCLSVGEEKFAAVTGLGEAWQPRELEACLDIRAAGIKSALYQLAGEVAEPGFAGATLVEALADVLLVELARYLRRARHDIAPPRGQLAPWQLRRITDYVESLVDPAPTLTQLAQLCEISPRHLRRAFRQTTGRAISAYVRDARLQKARSLLSETRLSLKEIAYRLGFASPSSFSIAFSKATGSTPKIFRLDHQNPRSSDDPGDS